MTDAGALMKALQFTDGDLQANRNGNLSQAQMEGIRAKRRRYSGAAAIGFATMVVAATVLMFLGQRSGNPILQGAGLLLVLINAILVGFAGRSYMRVAGDLRAGQVEALKGEVQRVLRRGRGGDSYLLRIDGVDLQVSRAVFIGFEHEAPYRVYRTVHAGLLLSAERLG